MASAGGWVFIGRAVGIRWGVRFCRGGWEGARVAGSGARVAGLDGTTCSDCVDNVICVLFQMA